MVDVGRHVVHVDVIIRGHKDKVPSLLENALRVIDHDDALVQLLQSAALELPAECSVYVLDDEVEGLLASAVGGHAAEAAREESGELEIHGRRLKVPDHLQTHRLQDARRKERRPLVLRGGVEHDGDVHQGTLRTELRKPRAH